MHSAHNAFGSPAADFRRCERCSRQWLRTTHHKSFCTADSEAKWRLQNDCSQFVGCENRTGGWIFVYFFGMFSQLPMLRRSLGEVELVEPKAQGEAVPTGPACGFDDLFKLIMAMEMTVSICFNWRSVSSTVLPGLATAVLLTIFVVVFSDVLPCFPSLVPGLHGAPHFGAHVLVSKQVLLWDFPKLELEKPLCCGGLARAEKWLWGHWCLSPHID